MAMKKFFYTPRQIVMVDFGPNPKELPPNGVFKGPLSVSPEMYKRRQSIVLSSMNGTTSVVPLSTLEPKIKKKFHFKIESGKYKTLGTEDSWVKANMITNVSNNRITRPLFDGKNIKETISRDDFFEIQKAVLHGLGMGKFI